MTSPEDVDDIIPTTDRPELTAELQEAQESAHEELDQPRMVVPVVVPPKRIKDENEPVSGQRERVLERLISMADVYARNGSLRQAIELYFELIINHGGSDQSLQSCDRLIAIAQSYENHGELRMARGIYERLLKAS